MDFGRSALVSGSRLGPVVGFFFCLAVVGFLVWGALSDESIRSGRGSEVSSEAVINIQSSKWCVCGIFSDCYAEA
jgi:hypothetical protein